MASTVAAPHSEVSLADRIGQMKKLLSVQEVAELLGENQFTIYRRCKRGTMPHYRLGSSTKFDPAHLAKWLRERHIG